MTLSAENFPSRLRQASESRRWTQADLAERSGFKVTAISHFECGQRSPSLKNFVRLCKALNLKPEKLL
jgi:transcriptional regulator with XRE-family HTH domain